MHTTTLLNGKTYIFILVCSVALAHVLINIYNKKPLAGCKDWFAG